MSSKKYIKNCEGLLEEDLIAAADVGPLEKVASKFSVSLTRSIVESSLSSAVRAQYVPSLEELTVQEDELEDPIGDERHTPIAGITHRYPDRVLLKAVHVCEVYCRFCFRREKVGRGKEILSKEELEAALTYIKEHDEIFEVILSGGDPLVMHPTKLAAIIKELSAIDHLGVIRIHTRLPLASPEKISGLLLDSLTTDKALFVVLHCNSHEEISEEVAGGFKRLLSRGIPLLSQSVLLKGVNDSEELLEKLFRKLVSVRVKPYYLHHPDKAQGTSHFRVPMKKGIEMTKNLRGHLSGICQPSYVLDIPGGFGKIPLGYHYIEEVDGFFEVEDWRGKIHKYQD
jgi:lysine 2,3-aminomutase